MRSHADYGDHGCSPFCTGIEFDSQELSSFPQELLDSAPTRFIKSVHPTPLLGKELQIFALNCVAGEPNSVAGETNSVAGETNFKSVSRT